MMQIKLRRVEMIPTRNFDHIQNPRRRTLAYVVQGAGQALEWLLVTIASFYSCTRINNNSDMKEVES